jgi:hypothetical protein
MTRREQPVKYILQMIVDERNWEALTPDEFAQFDTRINALNDELRSAGAWVSGEGLDSQAAAKTVRFDGESQTVTDGPASTATEQLGGFWIIEADSPDAAIAWAQKVPLTSGAIEVRPLVAE